MNPNPYDAFPGTKTVLLADDDSDDTSFITEAFLTVDNKLTIHTVTSGDKVLPFLESLTNAQLPQLILLDYNLPDIDGADVLQLLARHERYQAIAKIVWSTSNAPHYITRSLERGATVYMVKPSNITGIAEMARQMLNHCQAAV